MASKHILSILGGMQSLVDDSLGLMSLIPFNCFQGSLACLV